MNGKRPTDDELRALMTMAKGRGEDTLVTSGTVLAMLVGEVQDYRKLLDAARCRITALEGAGLFEISHLVREGIKGLP